MRNGFSPLDMLVLGLSFGFIIGFAVCALIKAATVITDEESESVLDRVGENLERESWQR